jgi:AcrR family transcriptional regulator
MHTAKPLPPRMDAEVDRIAAAMVSMPTARGKSSSGSNTRGPQSGSGRLSAVAHSTSAEAILGRAREIIDAEGVQALNVRRVAGDLKISTRTLYKRIGNRDRLIRVVVERQFCTRRPGRG